MPLVDSSHGLVTSSLAPPEHFWGFKMLLNIGLLVFFLIFFYLLLRRALGNRK